MDNAGLSSLMTALVPLAAPILAAGNAAASTGDASGIFVEDRPLPGLELPTIDGRSTVYLGALLGRRVIVLQFASW